MISTRYLVETAAYVTELEYERLVAARADEMECARALLAYLDGRESLRRYLASQPKRRWLAPFAVAWKRICGKDVR